MNLLQIIFVVLFVLWAFGNWYTYTDAGARLRGPAHFVLVILIGILAWVVFKGFRG